MSLWNARLVSTDLTRLHRSAVVNEMQQFATDQLALVYFYCNFGDLESRKPATVLCTLVAEFIRAGWTEEIGGLMKMKQTKGPRAPSDLDELSGLLRKATKFFKKSIIVVDALDECDDVESLLEHLVRLPHGGNVKLFLTSRKEQEIYELLKDVPYISLKDETNSLQSDMYKHISTELRKRRHLARLPAKLKQQIVDVLLTKADGM